MLKQWLKSNIGEEAKVPDGLVHIVFDNEHRLVKNYLTRGDAKVKLDIFTNVLGVILPETPDLNHRVDFKPSQWILPSNEVILDALEVPTVENHNKALQLCLQYMNSHLEYVSSVKDDPVDQLIHEKKRDRNTIQCPECHSVYDIKVRNCKNPDCPVVNIRAVKSAQVGSVVHEVHHKHAPRTSSHTYLWDSTVIEGRVHVVWTEQEDESATPCVPTAKCVLVEPCFVNPSSLEAVKELMRHVGQLGSVTQYGGKKREWMALSCDGVPYMLMRKVIQNSGVETCLEKLKKFGWVDTSRLYVKDLKSVLRERNLPLSGTKADLVARIEEHVNRPVLDSCLDKVAFEGEFEWVIPCMGGLHQEFMLCRAFLDINWDVAYQAFALSQGYHGPKQLAYIRSGKDHHKTFDDLSRYIDGVCDELLLLYCRTVKKDGCTEVSIGGFFQWMMSLKKMQQSSSFFSNVASMVLVSCSSDMAFGITNTS